MLFVQIMEDSLSHFMMIFKKDANANASANAMYNYRCKSTENGGRSRVGGD